MKKISKSEFLPYIFGMQISQSISNKMFSNFLWLLLTVLWREPCLRLFLYALDQLLCNLGNKFVEKCKEYPVFGHKMKTKPQMKNLGHGSLQKIFLNIFL